MKAKLTHAPTIEEVTPEHFHATFFWARAISKDVRRRTTRLTLDDYKRSFKCYMVVGYSAGFAINTATSELCSMFNVNTVSLGHFMVAEAVKLGAKRLNCLDGYLVKLYSDHGFVVTCAVEHNRSRPDRPLPLVVYMVHKDTPMGRSIAHAETCLAQA
jgi:hypothetical protein